MKIVSSSVAVSAFLSAVLYGCATTSEVSQNGDQDIIGGVPANSEKLDAVGVMMIVGGEQAIPYCTGTLISPSLVLTAKHCFLDTEDTSGRTMLEKYSIYFGIGADAGRPKRMVRALVGYPALNNEGGLVGLGADAAVLVLETPITDIPPIELSPEPLTDSKVGQRFAAIGYGVQDDEGTYGTRRAGVLTLRALSGPVYSYAYTYDEFRAIILAGQSQEVIDGNTPEQLEEAIRALYEQPMSAGIEFFAGAAEGDAQVCNGDSGGPLIGADGTGVRRVWGVASAVPRKLGNLCLGGSIYASISDSVRAAVQRATVCGLETVSGRCDGATTVRCTKPSEGEPRVVRTDCTLLGQTCGMVGTEVGCVDE